LRGVDRELMGLRRGGGGQWGKNINWGIVNKQTLKQ
jgi:hypothetical protein